MSIEEEDEPGIGLIPRVVFSNSNLVYSVNDIDTRTSNKAYSILKYKKINVSKGLLNSKCKKIYKKYFLQKKNKKPFIAAKIACSNDYYTDSKNKFITNKFSRDVSHILRYKFDAIFGDIF